MTKQKVILGRAHPSIERETDWLAPRTEKESFAFLYEVSAICAKNGEISRQLHDLMQSGRYRDVIEYEVPHGISLDDFRGATQIQGLLKKNPWVDLGYDPLLEGIKTFIKAERKCSATNQLYEMTRPTGRVSQVFHLAARKISYLLGSVPSLDQLALHYGPGATTTVKSAQASLSGKLSGQLACSEDALPFVGEVLATLPLLAEHHCEKSHVLLPHIREEWEPNGDLSLMTPLRVPVRVDDGKLTFVPKNAKTHRPIIVEPTLNGLVQLGIGSYLKDSLAFKGIDLRHQDRNRELARKGSIDGSLATLDLSSASDTVAYNLVADLLPPDWFDFLSQFRTGSFVYGGCSYSLEKFSSMGNGYTFELESILFYSLAWGATHAVGGDVGNVGIFGDDIIVPVEAVGLLLEVLDWAGFWVNPQKSFWSGPFRESCGADWLAGNDVRPFNIDEPINDKVLYCFHNWALRRGERELAKLCESWTWEHNRLYGPDGQGDGHLIGSHSLHTKRRDRRRGWCGGYFDTYSMRPKRLQKRKPGDWMIPAYSIYVRGEPLREEEMPVESTKTDPYVLKGSEGYVRTSIYTLSQHIFVRK